VILRGFSYRESMAIERKYTSPKRAGTGQNNDAFTFRGCILVVLCIEVAGIRFILCGAKYASQFRLYIYFD
jgi:hypothetical protein